MATRFLDTDGLRTLWGQIKSLFLSKDDAQALANSLNSIRENVGLESNLSLPNDFEYDTLVDGVKAKQNALVAGENINIDGNVISATNSEYDDTEIRSEIATLNTNKQDKLQAGSNIKINGNTISSTYTYNDTTIKNDVATLKSSKQDVLTAGANITISNNTISAVDTIYNDTAVKNDIAALKTGKQDKLVAGTNISINGNTISSTYTYNDTAIKNSIAGKQDKLTAGSNISISGNTISVDDVFLTKDDAQALANSIYYLKEDIGLENDLSLPSDFEYDTLVDGIKDIATLKDSKQDKLTAGANVTISNNTISSDCNKWTYGTAITGTSTTAKVFNTGIAKSIVGDVYLNTANGNAYQCTTAGNSSTAKWVYRYTFGAVLG